MPPHPRCPEHDIPLTWQTGWGYPSWVCRLCMEPTPEEE